MEPELRRAVPLPLRKGALCISIDLELLWGVWDCLTPDAEHNAVEQERSILARLLQLFERYDVPVTWATVASLFDEDRAGDAAPARQPRAAWRGEDMVAQIRASRVAHEIGSHTHAHVYFDDVAAEVAAADLERARRAHERAGLPFDSLVFPRNKVDHLHEVARAGISVFRSNDAGVIDLFRRNLPQVWPLVNLAQKTVPAAPPVVLPRLWRERGSTLVELPTSLLLMSRRGVRRVVAPPVMKAKLRGGLRAASEEKKLFHLWFHPSNFYFDSEQQFAILEACLEEAAALRKRGELNIQTMREFAALAKAAPTRAAPTGYRAEVVRPEDRQHVRAFASRVWSDSAAGHFDERWWWNSAPVQAMVARHETTGDIAALCAGRRSRIAVGERVFECTAICDWFVSPDHKGKNLGVLIARALTDQVDVGTTMSISDDAVAGFAKLGWGPSPAGLIPFFWAAPPVLWRHRLAGRKARRYAVESQALSLASAERVLDDELDALWEASRPTRPVSMVRDARALREHLALVPTRQYRLTTARSEGRLVGYVLSRDLPRNAFPRLGPTRITLLSDILTASAHDDAFAELLPRVLHDAAADGQDSALAMTTYRAYFGVMASHGLLSSEPSALGVRIPRLKTRFMVLPPKEAEIDAERLYLTALDSDGDLSFGC